MITLVLAGLVTGFLVGLTGTGGGALLTPVLVLIFRVHTMTAIGSDLVASFLMKPFGGIVHARHKTVRKDLVILLVLGTVPGAIIGVLALVYLGHGRAPYLLNPFLGGALLLTTCATFLRGTAKSSRIARLFEGQSKENKRKVLTVLLGLIGGGLVGFTSVGSGSIMVAGIMFLYPELTMAELVGTDLIAAIPLLGVAAVGHLIAGDVRFSISVPLLVGAIPGVVSGAILSARGTRSEQVRFGLTLVLLASGLRLIFS